MPSFVLGIMSGKSIIIPVVSFILHLLDMDVLYTLFIGMDMDVLYTLFFRLDHEYVVKGYYFHKGRMKVTVSEIFKVRN